MDKLPDFLNEISKDEIIRLLVSTTPVAYIVMDKEFRIHFINDYFVKFKQLDKETALGNKCYNLSNGGVMCQICAVGESLKTGKKHFVARKDILPSGDIRYMDDYAIPLNIESANGVEYVLEIMVDRGEEARRLKQRDDDFVEIIRLLSTLLETKDVYTAQHSQNVRKYSLVIAKALGLSDDEIFDIDIASSLHDIGKIFISNDIINKKGKLTDLQWAVMRTHPQKSRDLLENLSGLNNVKDIVEFHHERYNGKGYPSGLQGDEIPLGARIIAVADSFDAMTSNRSYRQAMSEEAAIQELLDNSGTQFDPLMVKTFVENYQKEEDTDFEVKKKDTISTRIKLVERQLTIDESKKAEEFKKLDEIIPESDFLQAIFDNAPVGYVVLDEAFNIVFANEYYKDMLGYDYDEIYNKKCYKFTKNRKQCNNCPVEESKKTGEIAKARQIQVTKNNEEKYLDVCTIPFTTTDNKKYIAEIIMNRTEDTKLMREHENEISALIKMLAGLLAPYDSLPETALNIAGLLDLNEEEMQDLELAASLCNLGMISVGADGVLLTEAEMYKEHAERSWHIFSQLSGYENVKNIILHHHEHYDGSGFPSGLKGKEIPLASRIIIIAEALEKEKLSHKPTNVKAFLKANSGTLFDPDIVKILAKD